MNQETIKAYIPSYDTHGYALPTFGDLFKTVNNRVQRINNGLPNLYAFITLHNCPREFRLVASINGDGKMPSLLPFPKRGTELFPEIVCNISNQQIQLTIKVLHGPKVHIATESFDFAESSSVDNFTPLPPGSYLTVIDSGRVSVVAVDNMPFAFIALHKFPDRQSPTLIIGPDPQNFSYWYLS